MSSEPTAAAGQRPPAPCPPDRSVCLDPAGASGASGALRLGVDLGGTKIEAVVVRMEHDEPQILARLRRPTEQSLGYQHIVSSVAELIFAVSREAGLAAPPPIGVGMPGSVTRARRTVKNSNTTCLNGRPFREDLIARVGQPIEFANDANCFALAEARYGAARGYGVVFGVILGTGVGGGIVLGGELVGDGAPRTWDGLQGIAGEWGHVPLEPHTGPPCYCGRAGCIETFLCGPALEAEYARRTGRHQPLTAIAAAAEATAPDEAARAVIAAACDRFGRAIATVINILDPEIIVLGGGVSHLSALYTDGVAAAARWVFSDELVTPIRKHQIGDSAGVLGAALLPAA
jgi:fructokinase